MKHIIMQEPAVAPISGHPMFVGLEYEVDEKIATNMCKKGQARLSVDVHMEKLASFGVKEITVEEGADKMLFVSAKKYGVVCHTKLSKKRAEH